jgi:hypothetical protein
MRKDLAGDSSALIRFGILFSHAPKQKSNKPFGAWCSIVNALGLPFHKNVKFYGLLFDHRSLQVFCTFTPVFPRGPSVRGAPAENFCASHE